MARFVLRERDQLNPVRIADFLQRKCAARGIVPTRSAYDDDIKRRAFVDYDSLFDQNDPEFIEKETAWNIVRGFVEELPIPP